MLAVGAAAIVAGLIGLGTIGYWYATDVGWTGTGSRLISSREQAQAAALVPVAAVLVGVVAVLVRGHVPRRSPGGVMVFVTSVFVTVGVALAVAAYPQVEQAELIAHRAGGWSTGLPVTEVWGVRAESDTTITLEGRVDRRGCDWRSRSVTLELSTGRILAVEALPGFSDISEIPPRTPIDIGRFEVRQGSAPFMCLN